MVETARNYAQAAPGELFGDALLNTFRQADSLLQQYQHLWRLQPINAVRSTNADDLQQAVAAILSQALPEDPVTAAALAQATDALSLQQIENIDASIAAQHEFFAPLLPQALALNWLAEPAGKSTNKSVAFPFWITNGIGGRKLGQIEAIIAHTPRITGQLVEWCAGKGHLGRLLSYANCLPQQPAELRVVSLEWQESLCVSGMKLAQHFDLAQTFQQTDVLSGAGRQTLSTSDHAIALHACGDLHRTLLEQAQAAQLKSLWLAPCCYHLTQQSCYQAMSKVARDTGLALSRDELKLAVQGQVTAGERILTLRQTEVTWRLAYQLLRERYADASDYRALPSVAKHWFSGQFEDFARWACAQHDWTLPQTVDFQALLNEAGQRYLVVKRLDLIRHVFRRPLEIWLALDRSLFLLECGYQVSLQAFCDYQMTPRNLLISAWQR